NATARPLPLSLHDALPIFLNLITNALKFTPEGAVRISGALDGRSGSFAIAVADTGLGIAEEDRERVFDEFRQVDGSPGGEFGSSDRKSTRLNSSHSQISYA